MYTYITTLKRDLNSGKGVLNVRLVGSREVIEPEEHVLKILREKTNKFLRTLQEKNHD